MIAERIEYSFMDRMQEYSAKEEAKKDENGQRSSLQLALEHLAYSHAHKYTARGKIAKRKDEDCWEILEQTLNLSPICARLFFSIAYQCPKEFRITHLSQTSQTAYAEPLEILERKDLITKGTDFYGTLYVLSLNLMRAIAFGREWQDPTKDDNKFVGEDDVEF